MNLRLPTQYPEPFVTMHCVIIVILLGVSLSHRNTRTPIKALLIALPSPFFSHAFLGCHGDSCPRCTSFSYSCICARVYLTASLSEPLLVCHCAPVFIAGNVLVLLRRLRADTDSLF